MDVTRRLELALRAASEVLEIDARGKNAIRLATSHIKIAAYEIALGDLSAAYDSAREPLRLARQLRDGLLIAGALKRLAQLAPMRGNAHRGALLRGYVGTQYAALKMQRDALDQQSYDRRRLRRSAKTRSHKSRQTAQRGRKITPSKKR